MTDYQAFLTKLHQNLKILREREAKYGGNAPLDLLNQIEDHQKAITLTEQAIAGELSEAEWHEALAPLNLSLAQTTHIFQVFIQILDAQPGPIQVAFQYCLCLFMVEAGKMHLVEIVPGESGATCIFETLTGDSFSVTKPPISKETEAALVEQLRTILDHKGD